MLLRLTLWALFIGSVIMGFFGYQTGSATTTVIGMMAMIFIAFLLFFLIKMSLQAGLMFVKIVIIVLLVGGIILLAVRGISYLWNTGKQTAQKAVEQSVQIPGKIQNPSFFSTVSSFLSGDKTPTVIPLKEDKNKSVTPKKTQKIVGTVTAVTNGTTFSIGERSIRLYGIDAPALSQTCLDLRGQSYKCGLSAKQKLGKLLLNKIIDCQLVDKIGPNRYTGTCTLKGYDVGAGMVSVGWAVADRRISEVYVPYQTQARIQHQGLWSGKFMAPWDYRAQSSQHTPLQQKRFFDGFFK